MARQQSCPYANKDCTLTFWVLVGHQHLLIDGLMTRLTLLLAVEPRIGTSCCHGAPGTKRRKHPRISTGGHYCFSREVNTVHDRQESPRYTLTNPAILIAKALKAISSKVSTLLPSVPRSTGPPMLLFCEQPHHLMVPYQHHPQLRCTAQSLRRAAQLSVSNIHSSSKTGLNSHTATLESLTRNDKN